jgi:hypothetical protein
VPDFGSVDCPHAPACSAATGCHGGVVVADWAQLVEERGGRSYAKTWQHPREATIHRSAAGEPMDAPPRYGDIILVPRTTRNFA